jgi:hypothetical protein
MPQRWVHETLDLIIWGKSYWRLHRAKDSPSQTLGPGHRISRHPWYQRFGKDWTFDDPFPQRLLTRTRDRQLAQGPDAAEAFQAGITHDYFDKLWDDLDRSHRLQIARALRDLIADERLLKQWAGVDVAQGLVRRTYGAESGYLFPVETWESTPSLRADYPKLIRYIRSKSLAELA